MSSRLQSVLKIPRKGYRFARSFAAFPGNYRHQNHRIFLLEESLRTTYRQVEILSAHHPAILNYVSSFAHTSRELTRNNKDLHKYVAELGDRMEFIRREILFECRYQGDQGTREKSRIEPKIINEKKLARMGDEIHINMGCGHVPIDGYLNLDMRELPGIDVVGDVSDMPFAPDSLSELLSSHLIEHFPQEELERTLLPYWYSLLKPGGTFRALLPDWETMITKFAEGSIPFDDLREVTFGAQDYDGDFHFNMFSQESLRAALQTAGFKEVSFPVTGRANGKCLEMEVIAVK